MLWWNTYFGEKCSGEMYVLVKNALLIYMFWCREMQWMSTDCRNCHLEMSSHLIFSFKSLMQLYNGAIALEMYSGAMFSGEMYSGEIFLGANIILGSSRTGSFFSFKSLTLCNAPEIVTKTSWKKLTQLNGIINVSYFVGASSLWSTPLFELPVA